LVDFSKFIKEQHKKAKARRMREAENRFQGDVNEYVAKNELNKAEIIILIKDMEAIIKELEGLRKENNILLAVDGGNEVALAKDKVYREKIQKLNAEIQKGCELIDLIDQTNEDVQNGFFEKRLD
jgi:hypothetical protein